MAECASNREFDEARLHAEMRDELGNDPTLSNEGSGTIAQPETSNPDVHIILSRLTGNKKGIELSRVPDSKLEDLAHLIHTTIADVERETLTNHPTTRTPQGHIREVNREEVARHLDNLFATYPAIKIRALDHEQQKQLNAALERYGKIARGWQQYAPEINAAYELFGIFSRNNMASATLMTKFVISAYGLRYERFRDGAAFYALGEVGTMNIAHRMYHGRL